MLKTNEVPQIWKPFHLKKMNFERNMEMKHVAIFVKNDDESTHDALQENVGKNVASNHA